MNDRFSGRGLNQNGVLSVDEVSDLSTVEFEQADRNRDKGLSRKEFISIRFADFRRFDLDKSEALERAEYEQWRAHRLK